VSAFATFVLCRARCVGPLQAAAVPKFTDLVLAGGFCHWNTRKQLSCKPSRNKYCYCQAVISFLSLAGYENKTNTRRRRRQPTFSLSLSPCVVFVYARPGKSAESRLSLSLFLASSEKSKARCWAFLGIAFVTHAFVGEPREETTPWHETIKYPDDRNWLSTKFLTILGG
jgi:hypothetical protein